MPKNNLMKHFYFKMKLKPGCADEYKKRHQNIWPELKELLLSAGIKEYIIVLDKETDILFASQKLPEDYDVEYLPQQPIMKKWWKYMSDLMETNDDFSPVCIELENMFTI